MLFCSACNKAVDHVRRQTIKDHLSSLKHKESVKRKKITSSEEGQPPKKQCTIAGAFGKQMTAQQNRQAVAMDFVTMCAQANIPLEKADHPAVRKFLCAHVQGGGAIPTSSQLRNLYLPLTIEEHELKLRQSVNNNTYIAIIVDETSDVLNRHVSNILFHTKRRTLVKSIWKSLQH